ncbi:glucose-6-phosphate isomerase [Planctomycetota bacterium]|nr:glucose-6-phosphate isomerase [Planctomycetota bacterium]
MSARPTDRLDHYLRWRCQLDDPFVELDLSYSALDEGVMSSLQPKLRAALTAMQALEGGSIANQDEQRMVGHYWLRAPGLAPTDDQQQAIVNTLAVIELFAADVHSGKLTASGGGRFRQVLLCGIGGSALGPMLLGGVFGGKAAPMQLCVLDNTDPDGIDRQLAALGSLQDALVIVISKSGSTKETRNGMLELQRAFAAQKLPFGKHAVAVTQDGSTLDQVAKREQWLACMPMWDWIGGRTSVMSSVGLLPGALLGMDLRAFLAGAAAMDEAGRRTEINKNPAAMLAAFWHAEGKGRGERAMVVLPYKDRLLLLSRYLQQLVMESVGKEFDRAGQAVNQGIAVYGNKGSTDQHAYVQQLRCGRHDFFAVFVRVLQDRDGASFEVESGATSGDFLDGFWQGTRKALLENGRASASLCCERLDERVLGALIALFERAVGIYAELINVNAYDQPGVEAGKKAAAEVLTLQKKLHLVLTDEMRDVRSLAKSVGADPADCWPILCHLAANNRAHRIGEPDPRLAKFARA